MSIRILPADVASQIAAGEVVERPASVVKELMENSLDASASHISVQIVGAGKRMIMVSDNGIGMSSQDLSLAIERHATSKLTNADDLFHIDHNTVHIFRVKIENFNFFDITKRIFNERL